MADVRTLTRSPITRYTRGERSPLAVEAGRRYHRDRGEIRTNLVEHWEDRPLDDPRSTTYRVLLVTSVAYTTDPDLAVALVRGTRAR